jgi:hypothetical protein
MAYARSSPPLPTPLVPRSASTATRLAPPPPRAASATTRRRLEPLPTRRAGTRCFLSSCSGCNCFSFDSKDIE